MPTFRNLVGSVATLICHRGGGRVVGIDNSGRPPASARPVGVDLFCGAGGLSLGFEQAGFDVLAAVDSDPIHLAVHERNLPHAHPICADVSTVTAHEIEAAVRKGWTHAGRAGEWDGVIDCLFGGPSCQGFSHMGKHQADDHRNDLVFSFARLVAELRPRTFVMENVPGLLAPSVRDQLMALQSRLRSAGYVLQSEIPHSLDAADFGVPQRRRRVFIVGVREGMDTPRTPTVVPSTTVADALDDLPNVDDHAALKETNQLGLNDEQLTAMDRAGSAYARSLRRRRGLEYSREWDRKVLGGVQRTAHSAAVRARFQALAPGDKDETSRTSRLDGDGVANTLRAGTGLDHGSFTAPRPIHHKYPRVITVREAARLHSYPDWFQFHDAKWHALREIGNSVPPRLAAAVAQSIVNVLGMNLSAPALKIKLGDEALLQLTLRRAAERYGYDATLLPSDVRRKIAKG